jgi:hypothetical protein
MELGWIDFSKEERSRVLDVIHLLEEETALDELGIAPIRDGFANIFFPGTSTIQTRAKYFLIVAYALSVLEHDSTKADHPKSFIKEMNDIERKCAETMLSRARASEKGIIGSVALKSNNWVVRTPLDVYWNGIRTYGIFTNSSLSYQEYVAAACAMKNHKKNNKAHTSGIEDAAEFDLDDPDAGGIFSTVFWKLPKFDRSSWQDDLKIGLTADEASFLKNQIIYSCQGSLFSHLLSHDLNDAVHCAGFLDFSDAFFSVLPANIQNDILLANQISEFIYALKVRYNHILSGGENEFAASEWSQLQPLLDEIASLSLDDVFNRLNIRLTNLSLYRFLQDVQAFLLSKDFKSLDEKIIKRESQLKGSRAKLLKIGEYPLDSWYGGGRLDFRFSNAMIIMNDIIEGEGIKNA